MSKIWDISSPTNLEPKNHFLGWLRNLTATLTAYVFGTKHYIDNYKGLLHCPKISWTSVHKRHQTGPPFLPTLRTHLCKFCVLRHCQALQTEISRRINSTTLPNGGWQIALTICCRTVGVVTQEKWGPRNFYICSVFRRVRNLMAKIFWTKRDIDKTIGQRRWKVRRFWRSYIVQ